MKALVMRGPGDIQLESVPKPSAKPGEALLRVRRVGLCGSDLNSYRGRNPLVTYPRIPGHEIAATVVDVSPFSTDGALVVANARENDRQRVYKQLMMYAGGVVLVAPALAWVLLVPTGIM